MNFLISIQQNINNMKELIRRSFTILILLVGFASSLESSCDPPRLIATDVIQVMGTYDTGLHVCGPDYGRRFEYRWYVSDDQGNCIFDGVARNPEISLLWYNSSYLVITRHRYIKRPGGTTPWRGSNTLVVYNPN